MLFILGILLEICIFGVVNVFWFRVFFLLFNDDVIFVFIEVVKGLVECWFWDRMEGFVRVLFIVFVVVLGKGSFKLLFVVKDYIVDYY